MWHSGKRCRSGASAGYDTGKFAIFEFGAVSGGLRAVPRAQADHQGGISAGRSVLRLLRIGSAGQRKVLGRWTLPRIELQHAGFFDEFVLYGGASDVWRVVTILTIWVL